MFYLFHNADYFMNMTAQINAVSVCADLRELANGAIASIQVEVCLIEGRIKALLPAGVLPSDVPSVVKWICAVSETTLQSYRGCAGDLTQILIAVAELTRAIGSAAKRLGCAVSVPSVVALSLIAAS